MLPYMGGGMPVVGNRGKRMTHNAGSEPLKAYLVKQIGEKIFCENGFHTLRGTTMDEGSTG